MEKNSLVILGSINIGYQLMVPHFPRPGETIRGSEYQICFGGKRGLIRPLPLHVVAQIRC